MDEGGVPSPLRWAGLTAELRLPYVEQGDPAGVPVVLLHAYADSWRSFELVLEHLPETIHAFAVTQRGHGDADRPVSSYRVEDFESDLAKSMDVVGLQAAVLVASSSATFTAQRFAVSHPERTLGLVLIGVPWSLRDKPAVAKFLEEVSELTDPVDPAFVHDFVASTTSPSVPSAFLDAMVGESLKVPARVWQATLQGLLEAVPPSETGTVSSPTIILWGDRDAFVPRSDQELLTEAIGGSQLVTYRGTGHVVQWEEPERVASDIGHLLPSTPSADDPALGRREVKA